MFDVAAYLSLISLALSKNRKMLCTFHNVSCVTSSVTLMALGAIVYGTFS